MSEAFEFQCPSCEARFSVISENTAGMCESYCPYCGCELEVEYDDDE